MSKLMESLDKKISELTTEIKDVKKVLEKVRTDAKCEEVKVKKIEDTVNTEIQNSEEEVEKLITDKLKQSEDKLKSEVIKEVKSKTMAEVVRDQMLQQTNTVNEDTVSKLVTEKIVENEREMLDRQSREKNVIIFKLEEPASNLIDERHTQDLNNLKQIVDCIATETDTEISINRITRMGARKNNVNRPVIVSFSTIDGKKKFLRYANALKNSDKEFIKNVAVSNDLTIKDRERELALVNQKQQKNSELTGPWKCVIRGPPGDRRLLKVRKET